MPAIYTPFYITCSACGHNNQPDRSPRMGVRKALLGKLDPCRGCGKTLNPKLSDRPLVRQVRAELVREGLLTAEPPEPSAAVH